MQSEKQGVLTHPWTIVNGLVPPYFWWQICTSAMNYRNIITIEPGKRDGKPCLRGLRITVGDVLGWLAAGMSHGEIIEDFPDLTERDIKACLRMRSGWRAANYDYAVKVT